MSLPDNRREEFERLYAAHQREVWAAAFSRFMDGEAALDVAQEAFLRLWRHWEAGSEEIANPRGWLLRVARNLAEDYAKSAFRRHGTSPPDQLSHVGSKDQGPADLLETEERFARLRELLNELPPADRDVLTYRYALQYDAGKIAELMGVTVAAVHMRLSRARQRLADRLEGEGFGTDPRRLTRDS